MINLDKYQEVYDIYALTNTQIEMNTGMTAKKFTECFNDTSTISFEAINNFRTLYGINPRFLNTDSFIKQEYIIKNSNLENSILMKEWNFLRYIHYFYNLFISYVVVPNYDLSLPDITKELKKLKLKNYQPEVIAKHIRELLVETYETQYMDVMLEKLGIRIVKRSLLKYGLNSYHVWIDYIPYIVVDKDINNKKYHISKEFYLLLDSSSTTDNKYKKYADTFKLNTKVYRDSKQLFEIISLLSEDNPNFLNEVMLQHELNIKFFNKLFSLDSTTISHFKKENIYE